jgi:hypothetical protein
MKLKLYLLCCIGMNIVSLILREEEYKVFENRLIWT